MKARACLLALLLLGGCASDEFRRSVSTTGAKAADRALEDAEWLLCLPQTVGAVSRRYSDEERELYEAFCESIRSKVKALLEAERDIGS